jgi:hypothetical protein
MTEAVFDPTLLTSFVTVAQASPPPRCAAAQVVTEFALCPAKSDLVKITPGQE